MASVGPDVLSYNALIMAAMGCAIIGTEGSLLWLIEPIIKVKPMEPNHPSRR